MRYFLILALIIPLLLHINASAEVPEAYKSAEQLGLPTLSQLDDDNITLVFSPEMAALFRHSTARSILPQLSLIPIENNEGQNTLVAVTISEAPVPPEEAELLADFGAAFALAKELSNPLYGHFVNPDNETTTDEYLYVDVSSVLLSYLIRQATDDKMDVLLLTNKNDDSHMFINGVELGIRPHSLFGVRLKVRDSEVKSDYGIELGLYPTERSSFKLLLDDNTTEQRTGLKFNLKF